MSLEVENEKVTFNVFRENLLKATEHPKELEKAWKVYPEPIIVESETF